MRLGLGTLVPPLVLFLAKHPVVNNFDLSALKTVTNGAAPLSAEVAIAAKERLERIDLIQQGYGLTELSPVSYCCPINVTNIGSVGVPLLNTLYKVIDVENGKAVGLYCEVKS